MVGFHISSSLKNKYSLAFYKAEHVRYLFVRYRLHRIQYFAGTSDACSRAGLTNLL